MYMFEKGYQRSVTNMPTSKVLLFVTAVSAVSDFPWHFDFLPLNMLIVSVPNMAKNSDKNCGKFSEPKQKSTTSTF